MLSIKTLHRWLFILGKARSFIGEAVLANDGGNRWVKTANGQNFADVVGVNEPPMTVEQSVKGVLAQVCPPLNHASMIIADEVLVKVDALEKSSPASGAFVNYDGSILPW